MSSTGSNNNNSNGTGSAATIGSIASLGLKLIKGGTLGPVTAAFTGTKVVGSFFLYTTIGRAIILIAALFFTYKFFESRFTFLERSKWEYVSEKKQDDIIDKVEYINSDTEKNQAIAKSKVSYWDSVVKLVTGEIPKVQAPHPIEEETIDLINQTRDKPNKDTLVTN
jgi:hypothetical protein